MLRRIARVVGEIALVWLVAASTAASFAPRGISLDVRDQLQIASPSAFGGLAVAIPAAGLCAGLWWLLSREYLAPLAVASAGLLVAALLLPSGLTGYFLPPPLALLAVAWVLRWAPAEDASAKERPD
jgi:hypothetical protein